LICKRTPSSPCFKGGCKTRLASRCVGYGSDSIEGQADLRILRFDMQLCSRLLRISPLQMLRTNCLSSCIRCLKPFPLSLSIPLSRYPQRLLPLHFHRTMIYRITLTCPNS
jgi:hypothetical protein